MVLYIFLRTTVWVCFFLVLVCFYRELVMFLIISVILSLFLPSISISFTGMPQWIYLTVLADVFEYLSFFDHSVHSSSSGRFDFVEVSYREGTAYLRDWLWSELFNPSLLPEFCEAGGLYKRQFEWGLYWSWHCNTFCTSIHILKCRFWGVHIQNAPGFFLRRHWPCSK